MTARRGLIFWALRLRSIRCERCGMDLIYRERTGPPIVCRWCGRFPVDILAWMERTGTLIRSFAAALAAVDLAAQGAAEQVRQFAAAYFPAESDQTRVDTDPNNG